MICENCEHRKCIAMVVRGVMDCDPPEEYCDIDYDPISDDECEQFVEQETYEDYMNGYDDYLLEKWECENDR